MSYVLITNGDGTSSLVHADESGLYLAHTAGAAVTSGYNVRSKSVYRDHDKGLRAAIYAFGIPGAVVKTAYNNAVYAPRYGGQTPSHVQGNKWKVTKQKRK